MPPLLYAWAADAVVLLHLLFMVFVMAGAALLPRWPRLVWLHLPALLWGFYVEASDSPCPLTPLENHLRALAGARGYDGSFIEHYLLPLIYPDGLTRKLQWAIALAVLAVNAVLYARWLATRPSRVRRRGQDSPPA